MAMDRITDLQALVAVVERGSLTAAARQLNRSLQSVSRSLATLEHDLGVELVRRTTRRSSATEIGRALCRRLSAALAEIEDAKREASRGRAEPAGLLRVTASTVFGALYLVPIISAFLEKHPRIELDLDLSDRYVDLVAEGFDLAVRIGEMRDSMLKARRLANLRRVVFAASSYLARHGRPKRPEDLLLHECIIRTAALDGNAWPFLVDGKAKKVRVTGRFKTSGALAANEAAVRGLGIANAPLWQVRPLVDRGDVELILTRFEPPPIPVHAVWPATRMLPARTQLFIDIVVARLKAQQL
jgi:DNA-binding transcriptional LysR family regulator